MKLAFFGTGLMGQPMVRRLLQSGHEVAVYNRTARKARELEGDGALVMSGPREALEGREAVILMLTDAAAIDSVLDGVPGTSWRGKTLIQMGTIAPAESMRLQGWITASGGDYFECPVLGSRKEAQTGRLILMVGSSPAQFAKWRAWLKCFGPDPQWIGDVGQAAALKLALNQLIASLMSAFSVSLGIIQRRGISPELFMSILRQSALYAPTFIKKYPRLIERNFSQPNFPVRHLLKDVDLILGECRQDGLAVGHLEGVRAVLSKAEEAGLGDRDYSALWEIINPVGQ